MKRIALLILTVMASPAESQAPECLTTLESCEVCVQRNGEVDIRACGETPPEPADDALDPRYLEWPVTVGLSGVDHLVAKAFLDHWETVIRPVLVTADRIYVPRELYQLAESHPEATASGRDWSQAAEIRFIEDLITRAARSRVVRHPTGTGEWRYSVQSPDILMAFVLRLLEEAGAFDDVDLSDYGPVEAAALSAGRLGRIFDQLLAAAACFRKVDIDASAGDALLAIELQRRYEAGKP